MVITTRFSEDLTRCGDKLPTPKSLQDPEPLPSSDKALQDDILLGLQQPMQRSVIYNTFMLERKNTVVSEDPAAMTIEFLRARLLSERTVAKAAKQKAELLAKKVLELQRKLEGEVAKRKTAEDLAATALENSNRESKLAGTFSSASLSAHSIMEKGESNDVSSFQRILLTDLSSHNYSESSSEDEIANAELFVKQKVSGERECSQKSSIVEDECPVEVAHQVDNNLHCDAYCYGPWSFVYSGSEDLIFNDYSHEEKDSPVQIPTVLHSNPQGVIENSHQMPEALIPVTQIRVPGSQDIYLQETSSPPSEMLAQYQIYTDQKARIDSAKDEDMRSATLIRTMSPIENRGCIDHGCSVHAGSSSGAKARLPPSSYHLTKKEQQENKRGTVEGNRYYIPSQEAQTPGIMATGFRRKFEISNPKQLLHRGFHKGTNTSHNMNERNQNIKQFDGNVQSSNVQAFAKQVKSAARCVLHAGVAENAGNAHAVNLKAGSKKVNITPKTFHAQELANCGVEAVSCIPRKEIDQGLQQQSLYKHDPAHSMDNLQLTNEPSSDSSASFQDCYSCRCLQGSRSVIGSVSSRHKHKQQQLECLERSTSTENQSLPLRRAQSYVDVIYSTPSSGAAATAVDFSHGNKSLTAYSMQRAEESSIENFSNYVSLGMNGKHELISNQTIDPAKESLQTEDRNEVRICIQERPMESVLAQNEAPSKVEIIETQQAAPAPEARIIFAERVLAGNQNFLEIKSEGIDLREQDQLARFIKSQDIQGRQNQIMEQTRKALPCSSSIETPRGNESCFVDEYSQNVNRERFNSGGSPTAPRYFDTKVKGYSSSQEIEPETNKIEQPSLIYTAMPQWSGSTKPSHCLVFRAQSSARDRDWHAQEQLPMSHKGLRSHLIPLAKSPSNPQGPFE